jgi:hypothetical protein
LAISSRIYIDDDGSVTITSLWGDLIPLVKDLGYINTKMKARCDNGTNV